jgi:dihydrolipoamide dehydrogenase
VSLKSGNSVLSMSSHEEQSDVLILGGGPAGYVAAIAAAQRGARVALIEEAKVGGTCLHVGCIPTKALATSADLLVRTQRAADFGLTISEAKVELPGLMSYKQKVVDQLVSGVEQLLRARRVKLHRGHGLLTGPHAVLVESPHGSQELRAPRIILATGSLPLEPPIEGSGLPGVIDSTGALEIHDVPAKMVVIGGGVIGLEFACIYEALGSQVTVLEMAPNVLPTGVDETIAKRLQALLRRRGMQIHVGATVERIEQIDGALQVVATDAGQKVVFPANRVLIATGRRPNTDDTGIAQAGIHMNGRTIVVDDCLTTNQPSVWAIGDAVGGWMLAHKAMAEGRVAAENATGGQRKLDYRAVPNVIFTRPEIAGVGLTEAESRRQGMDVKVSQFAFSANPRARILGASEGVVRLICEAASGRVLGVHMMGPHVTDLIAEGTLAVQMGVTADDLAWTTHAHPTLPEAMLEAALGFGDAAIHVHSR